jgi:hypothetical protein
MFSNLTYPFGCFRVPPVQNHGLRGLHMNKINEYNISVSAAYYEFLGENAGKDMRPDYESPSISMLLFPERIPSPE